MIAECRASGPIPPCNAMPVEVEAREGSRWGQNYSMETEQSGVTRSVLATILRLLDSNM